MARAEDDELATAARGEYYDEEYNKQNNGHPEVMEDLADQLQKVSSPGIRTSDREELIQCIKRGQRPTWVPKPNLKALCAESNAEAHGPPPPSPSPPAPAENDAAIDEIDAANHGAFSITLPEPIARPRSALHAGDFDAQPATTGDLSSSTSQAHQHGDAFNGFYASSPPSWLKLEHFTPYANEGSTLEAVSPSVFSPRPLPQSYQSSQPRSRTRSLGSSLSSSFIMRAPTSPLVHATSSPGSDQAEMLMTGHEDVVSERAARRRTMPTHTLVQMSSLGSTPSSPPLLSHSHSAPYHRHENRRSLGSFTYQPASTSQTVFPSRQRRFSQTPDGSPRNRRSMIGSFEESILRGRMSMPPSKPLDFVAQIGVLGKADCPAKLRCPAHVSVPFPAVFYNYAASANMPTLSDDSPSPYVGTVDLSAHLKPVEVPVRKKRRSTTTDCDSPNGHTPGQPDDPVGRAMADGEGERDAVFGSCPTPSIGGAYRVPQQGQLQVVIKNPNKTAVKLFLIPYDLSGMTAGTKTFVRQRSLSSGPMVERALSTDPERTVLDPLSGKSILRYLIHLKFCCLAKGRFYLYDSIRVVFANRVPEGKEKLRNEIQLPEPKYSTYVPGASSRRQSMASTGLGVTGSPPGRENIFPSLDGLSRHPVDAPAVASTSVPFGSNSAMSNQPERPHSPEPYGFDRPSTSQRGSPLPLLLPRLGQSLSRTSSPAPAASGDGLLSRKLRELSRQKSRD